MRPLPHPWFPQFLKFQEIKLQEMSEDVPMGHIPRAMTIQARPAPPRPAISSPVSSRRMIRP